MRARTLACALAAGHALRRPLIVFGRPGAGKTTIADALLREAPWCAGRDLDVCVPQWMRDNFSKGVYPTLEQRQVFAGEAASYVEEALASAASAPLVVSFSFVNDDLRDVFRARFPDARWALVDTAEADAVERILAREGHFYEVDDERGDEWKFAPVAFGHLRLDGRRPIAENVAELLPLVAEKT